MQRHVGGITLLQQNPSVLNWVCQIMWDDLHNGRKMVAIAMYQQTANDEMWKLIQKA